MDYNYKARIQALHDAARPKILAIGKIQTTADAEYFTSVMKAYGDGLVLLVKEYAEEAIELQRAVDRVSDRNDELERAYGYGDEYD